VLSLATRGLSLLIDVIDKDEAAHIVGAWQLLDGGRLYADFVDNKPPLLYVYYALSQLLLGRGLGSVHLLTVLLLVPLTALGASAFFGHDRRGWLAGLILIVYSAAFYGHDMLAAHGELLALLPIAWALVLVREPEMGARPGRLGACGLLIGVATLLKPTSVLLVAGVLAASLRGRARSRPFSILALALGLATPLLLTYAAFCSIGTQSDLVEWTVLHNLSYIRNPIPWSEALDRAASNLLPFLAVTGWLFWGFARSSSLFKSTHAARLVSWSLLFSLPPVFLGQRFFPHYFVSLYVPLALGAAPWAATILVRPLRPLGRLVVAHSLLALLGFSASTVYLYLVRDDVYEETRPVFDRVTQRLRSDACFEGASLFVWGFAPQLYYRLALAPASRFVVPQASLTGYVPGNRASTATDANTGHLVRERDWDRLMEDLSRHPATYIIDTSTAGLHHWDRYPLVGFPRLHRLVRDHYDRLDAVDRVILYRRRGCQAG
jgi:hypothetical protein